jgi:hypothetical protein
MPCETMSVDVGYKCEMWFSKENKETIPAYFRTLQFHKENKFTQR